MNEVRFTILGEPASKANSRRIVFRGRKPRSIKSEKALGFVEAFGLQCPCLPADKQLQGDLVAYFRIYYASRRPDLDESLVLDAMQDKIYKNDRQVKRRFTEWDLDPGSPRVEIHIRELPQNWKPVGGLVAPEMLT